MRHPAPYPPGFQNSYPPMQHPSQQPCPVYYVAIPINPYIQSGSGYPQPMTVFCQPYPLNAYPAPPAFPQQLYPPSEHPPLQSPPRRTHKTHSQIKKEVEQFSTLSPVSVHTPLRPTEEFSLSFTGSNPKRRLEFSSPLPKFVTPGSQSGSAHYIPKKLHFSSEHSGHMSSAGSSSTRTHLSRTVPSYVLKKQAPSPSDSDFTSRMWQSATSTLSKVQLPEPSHPEPIPSIPRITELIKN